MTRTADGELPQPLRASAEGEPSAVVECSSPPCFMHELDPHYLGDLRREEVSALLAALLAAGWGSGVADEARLRTALRRHAERIRGDAENAPNAASLCEPDQPARAIRQALPRIHDDALRRDFEAALGALDKRHIRDRG